MQVINAKAMNNNSNNTNNQSNSNNSNVSLFKNFISQYQSQIVGVSSNSNSSTVGHKSTAQQPSSSHRMAKLDINSLNNNSQNHSSLITEDATRAHTSHATKTFDGNAKHQSTVGGSIRDHQLEPVRRKLNNSNNNMNNSTSTTTRRMGDELRRIGI